MGEGAGVYVFQLAVEWHSAREAAHFIRQFGKQLGKNIGGGVALGGEIGGDDDFFDFALLQPFNQLIERDVVQIHALRRADLAHQHKIQAVVAAGGFHAGDIGGHVHNHQAARIALAVGTNRAQFMLAEGVATAAVADLFQRVLQGIDQGGGTVAVVL